MMKIGVDARCLARQLTGIGFYCLNIIEKLEAYKDIELFLFSPSPLQVKTSSLKNISVIEGGYENPISRQIWGELQLPFLIQKYHIDVFWGPSHRIPLLLSQKIPSVLTIHDLVWKKQPKTMAKATRLLETLFMPPSLKKADIVIADSLSTAQDIIEYYPKLNDKIRHIPLGPGNFDRKTKADTSPIDTAENNSYKKNYILFVGTIEPRKNLTRLLEAFAKLETDLKQKFELIIVGAKGWGGVDINSITASLNIKNHVKITGYVSENEMQMLYKNAYALAMPSLYEGFGLPILEAQSYGVPVITSSNSSMPEVAGKGAILVDPFCVESISKALKRLLGDNELRQALSAKAIKNVRKYSWEKTAEQTLNAFKEAIASKNL